jgi:hypothetical protein
LAEPAKFLADEQVQCKFQHNLRNNCVLRRADPESPAKTLASQVRRGAAVDDDTRKNRRQSERSAPISA